MRIGIRLSSTLIIQALLLAALIGCLLNLATAHRHLEQAETRRFESYVLADELRQSSDDLTRMARTYVVTTDERFSRYFHDIEKIRDGLAPRPAGYERIYWDFVTHDPQHLNTDGERRPLLQRMQDAGFVSSELDLLAEAKRRSDALIDLEEQAMALVRRHQQDPPGDAAPAGREADFARARAMMHGDDYHRAKSSIMEPINRFLIAVNDRTMVERDAAQARVDDAIRTAIVATTLFVLFSVFSALSINRSVRQPLHVLSSWADRVRSGDLKARVGIKTGDDFEVLAQTIDAMAQSIDESHTALQDEIVRRTAAEAEVRHLANHDALTGLPSLRLLRDRLERALALANRQSTHLGLLFIDLDGFKPVNDRFGHGAGDIVLQVVANRIRAIIRDSDTVGRIGGDEFVVILPDIASIDAAVLVKNKIAETTAQPIRLDAENTHVCVTASIGVAVYPLDANGPEDLLKVADAAMYQVKAEARFH
jgi:diguanylate cyclase (GGDEF)-like protein